MCTHSIVLTKGFIQLLNNTHQQQESRQEAEQEMSAYTFVKLSEELQLQPPLEKRARICAIYK